MPLKLPQLKVLENVLPQKNIKYQFFLLPQYNFSCHSFLTTKENPYLSGPVLPKSNSFINKDRMNYAAKTKKNNSSLA